VVFFSRGGNPHIAKLPGGDIASYPYYGGYDYHTKTQLAGDQASGFTVTYADGSVNVYGMLVTNLNGQFYGAYLSAQVKRSRAD